MRLHELLVLIAYEQNKKIKKKPQVNAHGGMFSGTIGLNFELSLHLHPSIVHAGNEGSNEPVRMHRLVSLRPTCSPIQ